MSYKTEVKVGRDPWCANGLRFATEVEADGYGRELLSRWLLPEAYRVAESEEPVNYVFDFDAYKAKPIETPAEIIELEID